MNTYSDLPPGFRFHPTDEELVDYYLRKKITSRIGRLAVIKEVDLYKIEPWDLQEICRIGRSEEQEWYFFSHKDKKYPTGSRTNRATVAGFWKATGRDKAIYCNKDLIGMRKTLVFYRGRAPNGQKSDWIMHEYRLQTDHHHHHNIIATPQEEGWVVCRVFKKRITTIMRKVMTDHDSLCWYEDQVSEMSELDDSPNPNLPYHFPNNNYVPCKKEIDLSTDHYLHPPLLASPNILKSSITTAYCGLDIQTNTLGASSIPDWRLLDKFVASQLSLQDQGESSAAGNNGFRWSEGAAGSSVGHQEETEDHYVAELTALD